VQNLHGLSVQTVDVSKYLSTTQVRWDGIAKKNTENAPSAATSATVHWYKWLERKPQKPKRWLEVWELYLQGSISRSERDWKTAIWGREAPARDACGLCGTAGDLKTQICSEKHT